MSRGTRWLRAPSRRYGAAVDEQRWRDPLWRADVDAWLAGLLTERGARLTGDVEQPHLRMWATVLRLPTDRGTWWFKANDESMLHEATLVRLLAERVPQAVPPLVAVEESRGWMVMADAGETLRTVAPREGSLHRWRDVLELYAHVQLALEDDVDLLLAAGVPDRRLAGLAEQYAALVETVPVEPRFRTAVAQVAELCEELAAYGIPETVNHDDLHDAQVFVRDGRHLLMDWGDACVSHPFFTLSVTLEGVIAWGLDDVEHSEDLQPYRDAYLTPYAERHGRDLAELVRASDLALRLGWACRAVNGHVPGDDPSTVARLRMFLDGTAG